MQKPSAIRFLIFQPCHPRFTTQFLDGARGIYNFWFINYNIFKNFNAVKIFNDVEIFKTFEILNSNIITNAFDTNLLALIQIHRSYLFQYHPDQLRCNLEYYGFPAESQIGFYF